MKTKSLLITAVLATAIFCSAGLIKAGPLPVVQTAKLVTNPAINIADTSVTFSGTPKSAGACYFEYGPTTTYGFTSTITEKVPALSTYLINISGLINSQLYHFRAVCFPAGGGLPVYGGDQNFTTLSNNPTPSVTVNYPIGNETWTMGQTYTIKWQSSGYATGYYAKVYLVNGKTRQKTIIDDLDLTTGTFNWKVPSTISDPNFSYGAGNVYGIEVDMAQIGNNAIINSGSSSDNINIVTSSYCVKDMDCTSGQKCVSNSCVNPKQLTVISPNGGETLAIGQTYNITWNPGNYPNVNVVIGLQDTKYYKGFVGITGAIPNTGSYQWTVALPTTLTAGLNFQPDNNYIISIGSAYNVNGNYESDTSDAPFTITTSTCIPNWQCTAWNTCISPKQLILNEMQQLQQQISQTTDPATLASLQAMLASLQTQLQTASSVPQQNRSCTDANNCGVTTGEPATQQSCTSTQQSMTVSIENGLKGNPVAQNIIIGQTSWLANFNFANNSQNSETVSSITFHKIGNASDASIGSVKLYTYYQSNNSGLLIASKPTTVSSGAITFSNLSISVPANSSVTIMTDVTPPMSSQSGTTVGLAINSASDIVASDNVSRFNVSGSFPVSGNLMTLTNQNTQPSITVISPSGGENWKIGETHNITWTSTGLSSSNVVINLLANTGNNPTVTIAAGVPASQGSYSWTIPSNLALGNYTMWITNPSLANGTGGIFTISAANPAQPLITVVKNSAFADGTISPNTSNAKIGSFIVQNTSTSHSVRLTSLNTNGMVLDLSALKTSDTTGSGSTPIQPTGNDTFSVNDVLSPGASMTIDIFANVGSASSGTVQMALSVSSVDTASNISATSSLVQGQTMTIGGTASLSAAIVTSATMSSQYIVSGLSGAQNASQATFNFVATGGAATITDLKFRTTSNAITSICTQSNGQPICASPVSGIALMNGLNLAIPNGDGGLNQTFQISYAPVGIGGLTPGTTSNLSLSYIKYSSGGTAVAMCDAGCTNSMTAISAPAVTLVGSLPTVSVNSTAPANGMIVGAQNQIGQVSISASSQGSVKINKITFYVGSSGMGSNFGITNPTFNFNGQPISGASCTTNGAPGSTYTVVCNLGSGYPTDLTIAAGQSSQFGLYATVNGTVSSGGATVSTSLAPAGFLWDDTSANGTSGVGLNANLIYGFPSNSYTISASTTPTQQGLGLNVSQYSTASLMNMINALQQQLQGLSQH